MKAKQARRVTLNGRKWVVGVEWSKPHTGITKGWKDGSKPATDDSFVREDYALYTTWGAQYGFVSVDADQTKSWLRNPCVSGFLKIPYNSFLGFFHLQDADSGNDFYWVFTRNAGRNLGGLSDACYESEIQALEAVNTLKSFQTTRFDVVFEGKDLDKSVEYLESLLPYSFIDSFRGTASLKPISKIGHELTTQASTALKHLAVGALIFLAGHTGFTYWQERGTQEASRSNQVIKNDFRRQLNASPEQYFSEQWNTFPPLKQSVMQCYEAINALPLSVGGWAFKSASCITGKVTATYEHTPGADVMGLPPNAVFNDGKDISLSSDFQKLTKRSRAPYTQLRMASEISRYFFSAAERLAAKVQPFPLKFNPPEIKEFEGMGKFPCPWTYCSWEFSRMGPISVLTFVQLFSNFPGITFKSLNFDGTTWAVKGDLYVRQP